MADLLKRINVLIIEDNPGDADLFEAFFSQSGYRCHFQIVYDGEQAIKTITSLDDSPDETFPSLIFLDINLPRYDGKEVLKYIRNKNKFDLVPIIVMTSSDNENDIRFCYQNGANCVLDKAYDIDSATRLFGIIEEFWLKSVKLVRPEANFAT